MNVFAYAPNPTGWVDPLGLSGWGNVTGSDFGISSSDINHQIYKAQNPKSSLGCSIVKGVPYTSMTTLDFSIALGGGGSLGGGYGFTCDENGKKRKCYSFTGCLSVGEGGGAVTISQAYTDSAAKKGASFSGAGCVAGTVVLAVGGGFQGCQNSDGSTTYAVSMAAGAKLGAAGSGCGTYMKCR